MLNGLVLNIFLKSQKNCPGRVRTKILCFVSGRAGLRTKFQFLCRAGPDPNFLFLLWAEPSRHCSHMDRAGPGPEEIRPVQISSPCTQRLCPLSYQGLGIGTCSGIIDVTTAIWIFHSHICSLVGS